MFRTLSLAAVALVATGSVAMAADLYIPETPVTLPAEVQSGFDWEGAYVGARALGYFEEDVDTQFGLGASIGYNFVPVEPLLFGLELQGNYLAESDDYVSTTELALMGRVGVLVTPDLLVYASGSVGQMWDDGDDDGYGTYSLGAGIEAAVTDNMSIRGDIAAVAFEDDDEFSGVNASLGAFFHF